jgi:hypothetical protein
VGRGRVPRAPWPGGARRRLIGDSGDRTLIAGSTDGTDGSYDEAALNAIPRAWTRTDADHATRVGHPLGAFGGGLNGGYIVASIPARWLRAMCRCWHDLPSRVVGGQ